jgi:hypothetical protein
MQTPDYEAYCKNITLTFPKLEKIEKDLKFMDTDTQMFIYHTLNGRFEEAESYRQSILHEQEQIKQELKPVCPTPEPETDLEDIPIIDLCNLTIEDLELEDISNDINN